MPCGILPEGIADKAFPPDSPARGRHFYATVRFIIERKEKPVAALVSVNDLESVEKTGAKAKKGGLLAAIRGL